MHVQLVVDAVQVLAHGVDADREPVGDLLVQVALGGALVIGFLAVLPMWIWKKYKEKSPVLKQMGALKYGMTAVLFLMMAGLPIMNWIRFFVWMAIGLVLYYNFGRKRSTLRAANPA